jgi:hypothetical protein
MEEQSSLDVSRWQAATRGFVYTPALWFFFRMIEVAYLDARTIYPVNARGVQSNTATPCAPPPLLSGMAVPMVVSDDEPLPASALKYPGKPTDEALLARDWIARSEAAPTWAYALGASHEFLSFPECCQILGLDPDVERAALLEVIDKAVDSDNDEAWARLDELSAREPQDDVEPLFDAPRVVPALDQLALFA